MRLVAFCEAAADFRTASDLIDRVLRDEGPTWVADVLDVAPEGVRSWRDDGQGHAFFDVHDLTKHVDRLGIRVPHGYFDGHPGAADATMARTAFAIVRRLVKCGDIVDAVVLIRDMDDEPERAIGLGQARAQAQVWATFEIVLGCAHPKREAWVLCGFDPEDDAERIRLEDLRRELGFHPHEQAHQLDATDEQAKRSAKRVLWLLTKRDPAREAQCWQSTLLDVLRARGKLTGLRAYLEEVRTYLVPRLGRAGA